MEKWSIIDCMKAKILKYEAIFEEQTEGGFTVIVPTLPGCVSEGDTFEEAKANIADAIKLYLEDMQADGEEIPKSSPAVFIGSIEIDWSKPIATS